MVIKYVALGLLGTGVALKLAIYSYRFMHRGAVHASRKAKTMPMTGFGERMSDFEARHILGIGLDATPEEVKIAHGRLIKIHHPDKGGSLYIARKLNEAKSQLTR